MYFLLLTMALDLSCPEFQPSTDLSGNYIVSSVSDNEPTVELLSELPPISYTAVVESDNTDIVDAINDSISHNDAYWELFLDSFTVDVSHVAYSMQIEPSVFYIDSSGRIKTDSALSHYHVFYVPVSAGVVYTISDLSPLPYANNYYRCGVVDSISNPTVLTNFFSKEATETEPFTIIPNQDGYLCFSSWNFNNSVSFVSNWVTYEKESYTLSELGNSVTQSYEKLVLILVCVSGCELILLFSAVVPFLTKVIDKLMNKKED